MKTKKKLKSKQQNKYAVSIDHLLWIPNLLPKVKFVPLLPFLNNESWSVLYLTQKERM